MSTGVATQITDPSLNAPLGVAVTPDGSKVYVTNFFGNTVSVISTATDMVTPVVSGSSCAAAIPVGSFPFGVTVNAVTTTITVGLQPVTLGVFITSQVLSVATIPGVWTGSGEE